MKNELKREDVLEYLLDLAGAEEDGETGLSRCLESVCTTLAEEALETHFRQEEAYYRRNRPTEVPIRAHSTGRFSEGVFCSACRDHADFDSDGLSSCCAARPISCDPKEEV
jgi:hypothetical protein